MSKHRVPRTGRPMLTFFGDLVAKRNAQVSHRDGPHQYTIRLFRTEAPGYVLSIHHQDDSTDHHWAAHTPRRLGVADLFDQYLAEQGPEGSALRAFREATQSIMMQAPELDEMIQWSSVLGGA